MKHGIPSDTGRYDAPHGDEDGIDIEPYLEEALRDVIDIILAYGRYPRPPRLERGAKCLPKQFDLYDFLEDHLDPIHALEFLIHSFADHGIAGEFDAQRRQMEARVATMLSEELRESPMVIGRAQYLAEEAKK